MPSLNTGNAILSNAITVDGSYNVGIGTSTPLGKLHVSSPTAVSAYIVSSGGDYDTNLYLGYASVYTDTYIKRVVGNLSLGTSATDRLYISSGGNVGIGTSSPTQILDVFGPRVRMGDGGGFELNFNTTTFAAFQLNGTERMRITSGGTLQQTIPNSNDGLFHQIPANSYTGYIYSYVVNNGGSYYLGLERVSGSGLCNGALTYSTVLTTNNSTTLTLGTNGTARVMITAAGFLKAKGDESGYYNASGSHHELRSGIGGEWTTIMTHTAANPYGLLIGLQPGISNTGNEFISAYVGNFSTLRFKVASNGGIYNYQSNDSNLSDIRTKKDITPLESYWNKFKAIEIVKFKYKEQSHDDYNIGVIAQQVEEVAPEFVNTEGWENKEINTDEPLKSIYTADLYHATIKVLQEAMVKIEELEAKVTALENTITDQQQQINQLINK